MQRWQTCGLQTVSSRAALIHATLIICLFKFSKQFFKPRVFQRRGEYRRYARNTVKPVHRLLTSTSVSLRDGRVKVYHNVCRDAACSDWHVTHKKKKKKDDGQFCRPRLSAETHLCCSCSSSSRKLRSHFMSLSCYAVVCCRAGRGWKTCSSCTAVPAGRSGVASTLLYL